MVRERAPKEKKKKRDFGTPRAEYMYTPPPGISIPALVHKWKGVKGCSKGNLEQRQWKESWTEKRKDHWDRVDRDVASRLQQSSADRREQQIQDAADSHVKVGKAMQGSAGIAMTAAVEIVKVYAAGNKENKDAVRAMAMLVPLMAKGVDVERKGLGMADKFVVATHTTEIVEKVLIVIQKYVKSAEVYENIMVDMKKIGKEAQEEVNLMLGGGE